MPHQCLKCGKVFPSGSPEILKGCNDCGGKRFFYTEQPVPDEEREHLIEQANKDIKVLIHEILAQSKNERFKYYDSEGQPVPNVTAKGGADWVKISPSDGIKTQGEKEPGDAKTALETKPEPEHKHPSVKDILKELRGKAELGLEIPEPKKVREKGAGEKKPAKGKAKTGKGVKGKVKKIRKPGRKPIKKRGSPEPEIITVKEPGVYDIQLNKLMKGFPIIINRDGTYLLHLPSVFESIGKERKK
jgi:predicted  nucleic acid-binding Zn-ribbon protein